jgi:hypothetical protein
MNRPSAGQAVGLGGVSIAAGGIAVAVAQIELGGQSQPRIWSNAWLLLALALAGTGLLVAVVFFLMPLFSREESKHGARHEESRAKQDRQTSDQSAAKAVPEAVEQSHPEAVPERGHRQEDDGEPAPGGSLAPTFEELGITNIVPTLAGLLAPEKMVGALHSSSKPIFTDRWRHTSDGFEASPLMNMTSLSMPGFSFVHGEAPQIRIGVCVACDPIAPGTSSSLFGMKLLELLKRDPVSTLIMSMIGAYEGLSWTRHAGNGVYSLEAVLGSADGKPVASALFQPPVSGLQFYGRHEGVACLWLHIDPRGLRGTVEQATLATWYQRFRLAIATTEVFATFLAEDLGLKTSGDPPARSGVMIETVGPIAELVDTGGLSPLPGAVLSNQFLGYAIADGEGESADHVAKDLLRQLCDHTLHLGDFEDALESATAVPEGVILQPSSCKRQGVRNTWETRDLPVLRAIVKLLEKPGSFEISVSQISAETGIDKTDVDRAIEALKGEYVTEYQQFLTGGDPSTWAVRGITPQARRAVGQWPAS